MTFLFFLLEFTSIQFLELGDITQVTPGVLLNTRLNEAFYALRKLGIYRCLQFPIPVIGKTKK